MDELTPRDELELRRLREEEAKAARNRNANEEIGELIKGTPKQVFREEIAKAVSEICASPNREGPVTQRAVAAKLSITERDLRRKLHQHDLKWPVFRCK